ALDDAALWEGKPPLGAIALHDKWLNAPAYLSNDPEYRGFEFPPGSIARRHVDWLIEHMPTLISTYKHLDEADIRRLAALQGKARLKIWGRLSSCTNLPEDLIELFSRETDQEFLNEFARGKTFPRHLVIKFITEGSLNLMGTFLYKVRSDPATIEEILARVTPERREEIKKDLEAKERYLKQREEQLRSRMSKKRMPQGA
ncbi:MAG: hypothetical protein Q6353_017065, partial [Candidatus Sigynarchaeum springense]